MPPPPRHRRQLEMVNFLLSKNVATDTKDAMGLTAYDLAKNAKHEEICKLLAPLPGGPPPAAGCCIVS